ncbi:MAG: PHP domain-containing protein [Clostridia bacterium]|nr:PHP domain-containing protein [Clostridia bacterium]
MIDLHNHSTYSDGSLTPTQLLELAEQKRLRLFSISDHNAVGAYSDMERSKFSGKLLTGCEFSTMVNHQNVEILGYGIDPAPVAEFFAERRKRCPDPIRAELHHIYETYKKLGVQLDWPEADFDRQKHISAKRYVLYQLREFEENYRFFLDPENRHEVLRYYRRELYNPESPLYVDYSPLTADPKAIVELIHAAGGKAFLAHCYQYTPAVTDHLLEIAEAIGLDGIECYYTSFTKEQTAYLIDLCQKNGLLISGGSDFHGALRPETQMGTLPMDPSHFQWAEELAN